MTVGGRATVSAIDVDAAALDVGLGTHPVPFRHGLAADPRFSQERVVALAAELPAPWVHAHNARLPLAYGPDVVGDGRNGAEVAATIEQGDDKVGLYVLERRPEYAEVLEEAIDTVAPVVAAHEGPLTGGHALLMLASPNTTVPVHFDLHHSLLFQLAGTKRVTVGSFAPAAAQQRELERLFDAGHGNPNPTTLPTTERQSFLLGPGDGLYIPPYTFHWVEVGDDVSVGFACGFFTAVTERTHAVQRVNAALRRLGLRSRPPGHSLVPDAAKAAALKGASLLRRAVRRAPSPR